MDKKVAGDMVALDDEGYLQDYSQWTKGIAAEFAKDEGIQLTDQHWLVIDYLQECYRNSEALSMRSFGKRGPVSIKEFYALFPGGPLKIASRIAGIPKPASCI